MMGTRQFDLLRYEMTQNATGFPALYLSSSIGISSSSLGEDDWSICDAVVIIVVSIEANRSSKVLKLKISI